MDIRKFAVDQTGRLHLCDSNDNLMYADGVDGKPDMNRPMAVIMYGPGSKQHARAQAAQQNRMLDKLRRKGKTEQTAEQKAKEAAEFLADCTVGFENMEYDGLTGRDLAVAIYSDITIGFIADQAAKFIGDWSNFTKPSIKD